jgi:hypothetical protein
MTRTSPKHGGAMKPGFTTGQETERSMMRGATLGDVLWLSFSIWLGIVAGSCRVASQAFAVERGAENSCAVALP